MDDTEDHLTRLSTPQILRRLERMVATGRVGEDDAAQLRAAADSGGLDTAVVELRRKHATARVDAAVERGRLGEDEARRILERLESGEDPRQLLRGLRRGSVRHTSHSDRRSDQQDVQGG